MNAESASPLLRICDLRLSARFDDGFYPILDGVSLQLARGEVFGLVGESGCGKSMTAMSVMKLFDPSNIRIDGGEILFDGQDLLTLTEKQMRVIRARRIAMIFQDPMTSLNPVYPVGQQIAEALIEHKQLSRQQAARAAQEWIATVGIPDAARCARQYPHQLSGGMRQRIMIAIALCCEPDLLIADEPTTALDVTVQHQIINLILDLQRRFNMAVILITHDLGLVAQTARRVGVMYAGNVVEVADIAPLFAAPQHPYTRGLLACAPSLDERQEQLVVIDGVVPSARAMRRGCLFAPRCPRRMTICESQKPTLSSAAHSSACWLHQPQVDLEHPQVDLEHPQVDLEHPRVELEHPRVELAEAAR